MVASEIVVHQLNHLMERLYMGPWADKGCFSLHIQQQILMNNSVSLFTQISVNDIT